MFAALILSTAQALSPAATEFVADATDRLIAGEELAADFPVRLQAMPPDQRLLIIVHLRRAGYLGDLLIPVDWVIAPLETPAPASMAGPDADAVQ